MFIDDSFGSEFETIYFWEVLVRFGNGGWIVETKLVCRNKAGLSWLYLIGGLVAGWTLYDILYLLFDLFKDGRATL
ncbi:hypothetical protein EYC80_003264 [Monilinia laxa]|uniref:Uncharacterized protein n=1 Tax=Monilinia laxa TaxID=61186 RepID=A0A5N6KD72_MONLA|nr:hypothetical protein EYC80_003264 [Monilinia laxa]